MAILMNYGLNHNIYFIKFYEILAALILTTSV